MVTRSVNGRYAGKWLVVYCFFVERQWVGIPLYPKCLLETLSTSERTSMHAGSRDYLSMKQRLRSSRERMPTWNPIRIWMNSSTRTFRTRYDSELASSSFSIAYLISSRSNCSSTRGASLTSTTRKSSACAMWEHYWFLSVVLLWAGWCYCEGNHRHGNRREEAFHYQNVEIKEQAFHRVDGRLEADVGVHPILQREEATGDGASAAISHQLQIGPQLSLSSLFAPR